MVKVKRRQKAEKSRSETFLQSQEEQSQVRDKERASGFQPDTDTLKAMIERMLVESGEVSIYDYEAAMNFLGVPVDERKADSGDLDIPF